MVWLVPANLVPRKPTGKDLEGCLGGAYPPPTPLPPHSPLWEKTREAEPNETLVDRRISSQAAQWYTGKCSVDALMKLWLD